MRMIRSRRLPNRGASARRDHPWKSRATPPGGWPSPPPKTFLPCSTSINSASLCRHVGLRASWSRTPGEARNDRFQLLVRQHLRAHHDRIDNQRRRPTVIGAAGPCHSSTARERSNKYRCRGACIDGYGCRHSHSCEKRRAVGVKVSAPRRRGLRGVQRNLLWSRHCAGHPHLGSPRETRG